MIIQTYQSNLVLRTLKAGDVYRAKPNLGLRGEYDALIDMFGLHCECPIFAVIKGRKQNTGGKVSGSVRLTLDVPDDQIHLTEYSEWADFLYVFKYTRPGNYKSLRPDCEEISVRDYNQLIEKLKLQKKPSQYDCPQVVLERIDPGWLKSVKIFGKSGLLMRMLGR
ncbi:hypothetical protein [Acutalibacter intestini]|uniref:hypothetical protein n=1 Tax=Acutalibacter intestini TaxID=3093659 RepID=UPI002AC9589A|nr:hypothetical protein [Acutalibacter sp. M00204]